MRRRTILGLGLVGLLAAACSLSREPVRHTSLSVATATLPPAPASAPTPTSFPTLSTDTGPYPNVTALLDGVCFEYLALLDGQTWVWATPEDLAAFYDQVDASQRCGTPVARGSYDFAGAILAGAVNAAAGCGAAHHLVALAQDDAAHTQTLTLEFQVLPGCPYELVQPLLVALPPPPEGYSVSVAIIPGGAPSQ